MKDHNFFGRLRHYFAALILLCVSVGAFALPQYTVIDGNPLKIHVGEDNSFQVYNADIPGQGQVFPTGSELADMGWFVQTQMGKFAPSFSTHGVTATSNIGVYTPMTPVTLSGVTGAGTDTDPYTVVVTSELGVSGLTATMKVTYVNGEEFFRKQWTLQNDSGADQDVSIFLGADIYLASSDSGIPHIVGASDSPGGKDCGAGTYNILLVPQTPVDAFSARRYSTVWTEIGNAALNNIVDAATCIDNGAALQWNRYLPAGGFVSVGAATSFGPIPAIAEFNILSVDPSQGMRGETVDVVITGVGFWNDTSFDFGVGITVTNVVIVDSNTATATLIIDSNADLGFRDVSGRQGTGSDKRARLVDGFEVIGPTGGGAVHGTYLKEDSVVIRDGRIYVWGERDDGLQGNGFKKIGDKKTPPTAVNGLYDVVGATGNEETIFALTKDGDVYAWGENDEGNLGCNISAKYLPYPCFVMGNVEMLDGAENFTVALDKNGDVWTWGDNADGQLGTGKGKDRYYPAKVTLPAKVRLIGRGEDSAWAVTVDNRVFAWGENDKSSMSLDKSGYYYTPVQITNLDRYAADIVYIGGGEKMMTMLLSDGRVFGWGRHSSLGIGVTNTSTHSPIPVQITSGITKMFSREEGTIAIDTNGQVYTWGYVKAPENYVYGTYPTLRPTHGRVVAVGGGEDHFLYETEDGRVFGVGNNDDYLFNKTKEGGAVYFPGIEVVF